MKFDEIVEIGHALGHPARKKILELCLEKKYSITELQNRLEIKSYKSIYEHVKILERNGLIKLHKQMDVQGKTVLISSDKLLVLETLWKVFKEDFGSVYYYIDKDINREVYRAFEKNKFKLSKEELKKRVPTFNVIGIAPHLIFNEDYFDINLKLNKDGQKAMGIKEI